MHRSTISFITFLAFLIIGGILPAEATNVNVARERRARLASAKTAEDSLKIMLDELDALPHSREADAAKNTYNLAKRLKRGKLQLSMLRQLADDYFENDSALRLIRREMEKLDTVDGQLESLTFVKVLQRLNRPVSLNEERNKVRVAELTRKLREPMPEGSLDVNERVLDMFDLVNYLRRNSPGILLDDVLVDLHEAMHLLPYKLHTLRLAFYTQSAMAYTTMALPEKAVQADSIALSIIDDIQREKQGEGRDFLTFDLRRYQSLRRMLHNSDGLAPGQVELLFERIKKLADRDPDVAADIAQNGRALINYYVAVGDWHKAMPLLKQYINHPDNLSSRRKLLKNMVEGARITNDHAALDYAQGEYIKALEKFLEERYDYRVRELQIAYKMSDEADRNTELEKENQRTMERAQRSKTIAAIIIVPLLLLLIAGLLLMYRHSRRLSANLQRSVKELKKERDNVLKTQAQLTQARDRAQAANRQKSEFINNMTHEVQTPLSAINDYSRLIADCADDEKHPYLDHYARLIELNNELVQTMINDVLEISEIDNQRMRTHVAPASANAMCEMAVESARSRLRPGVTMDFIKPSQDVSVTTDARRVEQVLLNLLNNAAKFTAKGWVKLRYNVEGDKIVFSVSDTGSGIPPGKEELIFQRFEKLDATTQGAGLGLPIARLIAGLLHGTVALDRQFSPGSRFVFTIPLNQ